MQPLDLRPGIAAVEKNQGQGRLCAEEGGQPLQAYPLAAPGLILLQQGIAVAVAGKVQHPNAVNVARL